MVGDFQFPELRKVIQFHHREVSCKTEREMNKNSDKSLKESEKLSRIEEKVKNLIQLFNQLENS